MKMTSLILLEAVGMILKFPLMASKEAMNERMD